MNTEEHLSHLLTAYHNRKEILKNKGMHFSGIGTFTTDCGDIRSDDDDKKTTLIIKKARRAKYKEPTIYIFIPGGNHIGIKRLKDGTHVFTRINQKYIELALTVPTESDEYFNFSLEHEVSIPFDDLQLVLTAFKQINHTVAIRLWD